MRQVRLGFPGLERLRSALQFSALTGVLVAALGSFASSASASDCVPFSDARQHIGKTQCVSGTVLHVKEGSRGVTFLDFCEDYRTCPFTVVVFPGDLKQVGDVRQLKGHAIEIKGTVQDYDGRAEIILRRPQQLGKDASLLPPLPKDYDVERRGHYSAGKFSHPKAPKHTHKKQGPPVGIEDPENP
jgi:DNA/RNA endonuclease YhcR with UshA esterase domain